MMDQNTASQKNRIIYLEILQKYNSVSGTLLHMKIPFGCISVSFRISGTFL